MVICYYGVPMERKRPIAPGFLIFLAFLVIPATVQAHNPLRAILCKAGETRSQGGLPVVIFDLDGTLFHTGFRSKRIFVEYAEEKGDTALARMINSLDPAKMKYVVRTSLAESGIRDSTVLKEMIDDWRDKFFTDRYLTYDEHLPGSIRFVNALHDSGALIIYLTGRDAPDMLLGTVSSLKQHGFPIGIAKTELIMKPERYLKTFPFKERAISYIEQLGTVIAVFDNEPAMVNLLAERFPEAIACALETAHAPNAPSIGETIYPIEDYHYNEPLNPTEDHMQETR
jgi:hypothetical protein